MNINRSKNKLLEMLLHIFYPNRCLLCNKIICYDYIYCDECNKYELVVPIGYKKVCTYCECYSPFFYSGESRDALLKFKYGKNLDKGIKFSHSIVNSMAYNDIIFDFDVIVYIPVYGSKNRFNTSYELGKKVSKITQKPILSKGLIKIKDTQKQHALGYEERQTNLIGAFHCPNPELVANKRILLVDDVCTTGSTFNVCASILLQNGATNVISVSATTTRFN